MSLEEDDDEEPGVNPWDKLRNHSGPMSSVSETGSFGLGDDVDKTSEVRILRISNLARGYTMRDLHKAFDMTEQDMRIEIQGSDSALVHFKDPSQAMKAYFTYLSSTSSIGTVSPYESGTGDEPDDLAPAKAPIPLLRNRRSFQTSNGNMLSALSNISSWRSSDKLQSMNSNTSDKDPRLGHRRTSSRSSLTSKSADKSPSLVSRANFTPPVSPAPIPEQIQQQHDSDDHAQELGKGPPTTVPLPSDKRHQKSTSTARRIFSGTLGLKLPKRDKTEKAKDSTATKSKATQK